jgi:Arc/MetJ-type ribon-helix-helix transcriptional regulator
MRTFAVRLDDDTAELLETVSDVTKKRTSDLIRLAVRNLLADVADNEDEVRAKQEAIAARRQAANARRDDYALGLSRDRHTVDSIPDK